MRAMCTGRACHHDGIQCIGAHVFGSANAGIVVTDVRARIVLANNAFLAAAGCQLEDTVGQHPYILGLARRDRSIYRAISRIIVEIGPWSGQIRMRSHDGEINPVWLQIDALHDTDGRAPNYVAVLSDIARFSPMQDELYRLAYYDALTGLPNRRLFQDRLTQAITHAFRSDTGFSLLFIDLDGFKAVNDRFGHGTGDRVLVDIAQRIRTTMRASDTVARLAGDEFVAILDDVRARRDAGLAATKILRAVSSPLKDCDGELRISASIGIARFPRDGTSADELLQNADRAMYRAKASGRNRYRFHVSHQDITRTVAMPPEHPSAKRRRGAPPRA